MKHTHENGLNEKSKNVERPNANENSLEAKTDVMESIQRNTGTKLKKKRIVHVKKERNEIPFDVICYVFFLALTVHMLGIL